MENLDRILVADAGGHVNEGEVDLSGRLPFGLTNLLEPNALKTARSGWAREEPLAQGALR